MILSSNSWRVSKSLYRYIDYHQLVVSQWDNKENYHDLITQNLRERDLLVQQLDDLINRYELIVQQLDEQELIIGNSDN
jgi:hypothetical protein